MSFKPFGNQINGVERPYQPGAQRPGAGTAQVRSFTASPHSIPLALVLPDPVMCTRSNSDSSSNSSPH